MSWKPKKWVAVVLSVFTGPLAMVYVDRRMPAVFYSLILFVLIFIGLAVYGNSFFSGYSGNLLSLVMTVLIATHSLIVARNAQPTFIRKWYTKWWGLIVSAMVVIVPLLLMRTFFGVFNVPAMSMHPTLMKGSIFVVQEFGFGKISRGDVVAFFPPEHENTTYVKRIVGIQGDSVRYQGGRLYINDAIAPQVNVGSDAEFDYAQETIDGKTYKISHMHDVSPHDFQTVVPAGSVFVMGDNRENSQDSRYFGSIPLENLTGKALWVK